MYVSDGLVSVALVLVRLWEILSIVTKSFASPLLTLRRKAKWDVCSAACTYIIKNHMATTEHMKNYAAQWNSKPNVY